MSLLWIALGILLVISALRDLVSVAGAILELVALMLTSKAFWIMVLILLVGNCFYSCFG